MCCNKMAIKNYFHFNAQKLRVTKMELHQNMIMNVENVAKRTVLQVIWPDINKLIGKI